MFASISRRTVLARLGMVLAPLLALPTHSTAQTKAKGQAAKGVQPAKTPVAVYKDANCGCCHQWVEYMQANGFAVTATNAPDMTAIRKARGIPDRLASCHTAHVGGYLIEGHVPVSDIRRLLAEKPKGVVGLTIPGMPQSAPGMDMKPFQPYTVFSFDAQGKPTIYAVHKTA